MATERVLALLHRISAGSQFTGTAPAGAATVLNNVKSWAAGAAGGLFDPEQVSPVIVKHFSVTFGSQSSWILSMTDGTDEVKLKSGTNETELNLFDVAVLPVGWKLKLTTVGASAAMKALMVFARSDLLQ